MKTDVGPLVALDMRGHFGARLQLSAGKLVTFDVGPYDVIRFAGWNSLGELTGMIGIDLPARFFGVVVGTADFYLDAIQRMAVSVPHRSEDQRVGLRFVRGPISRGHEHRAH